MIRAQRRLHARVFLALTPLLAALFLYALITRQRAVEQLRAHAQPAPPLSTQAVPSRENTP